LKYTRDWIGKLKHKKSDLNYDDIFALVATSYVGRHGASAVMRKRGRVCYQCYKLYGKKANHIKCLLPKSGL
jgi:hypothetical protein